MSLKRIYIGVFFLLGVCLCGLSQGVQLPITINTEATYAAATLSSGSAVSFADGHVTIATTGNRNPNRLWTLHLADAPDSLRFVPTGSNTWMIEESADNLTWQITFYGSALSPNQVFAFALRPSSRYVRISYGTTTPLNQESVSLSDVTITAFDGIRLDAQETIYVRQGDSTMVHGWVRIDGQERDTTLVVRSGDAKLTVTANAGALTKQWNVETFVFPRSLPLHTATDPVANYYYYMLSEDHAYWDAAKHEVCLESAPTSAERSLTMAFADMGSRISWAYRCEMKNWIGRWILEESADGQTWTETFNHQASLTGRNTDTLSHDLAMTTRYVRLRCAPTKTFAIYITSLDIVADAMVSLSTNHMTLTSAGLPVQQALTLQTTNVPELTIETDNAHFTVTDGVKPASQQLTLGETDYPTVLGMGKTGSIGLQVVWQAAAAMEQATLRVKSGEKVVAEMQIDALWSMITSSLAAHTGIYTGLVSGLTDAAGRAGSKRREIDLQATFGTDGLPLFDKLILFGETGTTDGSKRVSKPTASAGSNSLTPCYIYRRTGAGYELERTVENINTETSISPVFALTSSAAETLKVYISGFAPYASIGYTYQTEGVFCFRGGRDDKIDIYLEDAYIYSRNKTQSGCTLSTRNDPSFFDGQFAQGSGGVLVFECSDKKNSAQPLQVAVHTRGRNTLMSANGSYYSLVGVGYATQVSSPIQIHLMSDDAAEDNPSCTVLDLDDKWPLSATNASQWARTNGFLSLQKQANNAPSIDMGNASTTVNFRGGQVELQNAMIGSNNYKTTLAISYRSGRYANILLSYGMGTDDVGGTVNFWDGTTTVLPMTVPEEYRQYYLMDDNGTTTSCLRCPANTHVYGGSQCWLRACSDVESRGGAPRGYQDKPLGQIAYQSLEDFDNTAECIGGTYGVESVTADLAGNFYLWLPQECDPSIHPETDGETQYWMAAMTEIRAEYGTFGGAIGGPTTIGDKVVSNFLYCVIDEDVSRVISAKSNGAYTYQAPVKNPGGSNYMRLSPSYVGEERKNNVTDVENYQIDDHIYYICPATADVWMTFAAPFDVKAVYVVETFDENRLAAMPAQGTLTQRETVMREQARHNADFAAFFGVVMALGSNMPFSSIFDSYLTWAKEEDRNAGIWTGGTYDKRGMYALTPYSGSNWSTANFYLYENQGTWPLTAQGNLQTRWQIPAQTAGYDAQNPSGVLMQKGHTYSLLFPYNWGADGGDMWRQYWDYWSGKFLIFVGDGPQTIAGTGSLADMETRTATSNAVEVQGNYTFSEVKTRNENIWEYSAFGGSGQESFWTVDPTYGATTIDAATAFLVSGLPTLPNGARPRGVNLRTGVIAYEQNTPTDMGHVPGLGSELQVVQNVGEVEISVARAQQVCVLTAAGQVCWQGRVETQQRLHLAPGLYMICGETMMVKQMIQ